ncbi:MAG: hypothetical protein M1470_11210 [Bacteroidetes bacterium]|nr:hypothetical protein [Bacteroidota bacterium]MCL5739021.1 hypothetical protein [Bacteroidota bacterium]
MPKLKTEALIAELEEAALQLGLKVIYEKGDFSGGYCILKEEKLIVINKRFEPKHRASTLAKSLSEVGIENLFLKPAVREYIEEQMEPHDETSRSQRT